MNIHVDDNNEVLLGVQTDEIDLRAGDTINLGSSDYNDLTNKPSIEGVELVGDVSLDDLGAACAEDIPTDVSELINDAGYITANDIPPKVIDIVENVDYDPSDYDDDIDLICASLCQNDGCYRVVFDDFVYYVFTQKIKLEDETLLRQTRWGTEEGALIDSIFSVNIEEGEVTDISSSSYMTYEQAFYAFATINHQHWASESGADTVWDYCDTNDSKFSTNNSCIIYKDTTNNKAYIIDVGYLTISPYGKYQRVQPFDDASHFYQRIATRVGNTYIWGNWEEYSSGGGMNITVNGTKYPITAITKTEVSGVSGVLVDYDDGHGGQLFFADGVGLSTVKSAIELTIPHDTSELTNGAGFITISDLPIYNGGVS